MKQGIEVRVKEVYPDIVEVVDTTDHSTGENPYF
jgi:Fe-S cluster biogenesis protein NfuA